MTGSTIGRIVWAVALITYAIGFLDTLALTVPSRTVRYLRSATRQRLLLGILEAGIILGVLILYTLTPTRLPIADRSPGWFILIGGMIALAGALLAGWAKITLGRHFTGNLAIKEEHALVQEGPYGHLRHPIYLGVILFALGSGPVWNSYLFAGAAAGLYVCLTVQSRIEDRLLASHFGDAFDRYRARVPALIPRLRRSDRGGRS